MLLLHMQIRRYFNKICDNGNYLFKHIMMLLIKIITSVLKVFTYIITSVTTFPVRLNEILVIMSVLTFKLAVILYALLYILYTYLLRFEIYTILDLSCDKRFLRAISYRRRKGKTWDVRCDKKSYFKQNMSTIVCLLRIWWDDVSDDFIVSHLKNWYYVHITIVALIISIVCKDQRENVQIIHVVFDLVFTTDK
jgi:hypothetical protein